MGLHGLFETYHGLHPEKIIEKREKEMHKIENNCIFFIII